MEDTWPTALIVVIAGYPLSLPSSSSSLLDRLRKLDDCDDHRVRTIDTKCTLFSMTVRKFTRLKPTLFRPDRFFPLAAKFDHNWLLPLVEQTEDEKGRVGEAQNFSDHFELENLVLSN